MKPTRRHFLLAGSAAAVTGVLSPRTAAAAPLSDAFPSHPPELAREMVGVSHGNIARVKELLAERPSLAKAVWEWGFGDWETALGAASHVGNKEIASILLAAGAHPTIFSAAMLGQLGVVKVVIAASPGIQLTRGPLCLSLLHDGMAGASSDVVL